MGRPAYEPGVKDRKLVKAMVLAGINQEVIAEVLGIAKRTLLKYYRQELTISKAQANGRIAAALYRNAMKGNVAAQIFIAKTQLGWKETAVVEHAGSVNNIISDTPMTAEEWANKYGANNGNLEPAEGAPESTD